ncbi:hypothetical protein [Streptomyces atacamensis]|uniref:hypothetical protein n=1 Tax=Streptomyces atacamensis TaxID=531966 RepID=UPI00399C6E3C
MVIELPGDRGFKGLAALLTIPLAVATVSSCTDQGERREPRAEDSREWLEEMPVEEVCGHLTGGEKVLENRKVYAQNGLDLFAKAGDRLAQNFDSEPLMVCSFSLDPQFHKAVEIKFSWSDLKSDARKNGQEEVKVGSDSTLTRGGGSSETLLRTRCLLEGKGSSKRSEKKYSLLAGALTDKAGISAEARLTLLAKSTRRVAAHVECQNNPTFPEGEELISTAQN